MKMTYTTTRRACYLGFVTQAISVNFPPLIFIIFQNAFGLGYEQVGRLVLINFSTQIVADVFATRYADRIGYRVCTIIAFLTSFVGLNMLAWLPRLMGNAYLALTFSVMVFSWGSGFIEVLISPIVEALPSDNKDSRMSLLHSFYCWGQMGVVIVTTLLLRAFGEDCWPYLAMLWSLIPLSTIYLFARVPLVPLVAENERQIPLRALFADRFFFVAMLLMICAGSSELAMSQWSSLFAEKGLGISKVLGDLLGPCLYAMGMGVNRVLYGFFGPKINLHRALTFCAGMTIVCYALSVFALVPALSLLGCALCGFSTGLLWPGTLSSISARYPLGGTAMFGVLAVCGDIGGSLGPWLAGLTSDIAQKNTTLIRLAEQCGLTLDQMGLKCGMFVAMLFPVSLFVLFLFSGRKKSQKTD